MQNYSDELLKGSVLLKELNILALSFCPVEGNLIYNHPLCSVDDPFNSGFFEKRFNLFQLARGRQSIMEIGFNAGHSTLVMLLANPDARYVLFDLNFHAYTDPCFKFLKQKFPKMSMVYGDSKETVSAYAGVGLIFDLIHIDGSHEPKYFLSDLENSKKMSNKDTVFICDDTTPGNFLDTYLKEKINEGAIEVLDAEKYGLMATSLQTVFRYI